MKFMKKTGWGKITAVLLCMALAVSLTACGSEKMQEPVKITIWTYYNGAQLDSFNRLIQEFNETVGAEKGIQVESYSQGSVNDLEVNVRNSAEGKVGAEPMPNIFSAYADTASYLDTLGLIADLRDYMSDDDLAGYIAGYLLEGDIDSDGGLKIFPVAKSTELLFINDTDWQQFASATNTQYSELETIEGLINVAERYYNWTDSQTSTPDDGKALFGRDAMANYMYIGAIELGDRIFDIDESGKMTVVFKKSTARKLWDSYYVPFIKGYFSAAGRFRSDDVKTGSILGYVGSSSSATFFPKSAAINDSETHDITMKPLPCPKFENCPKYSVQQGAGMAVTKKSDEEIKASIEFLKWFTKPENNISFAVESGYLPVMYESSSITAVTDSGYELNETIRTVLEEAFNEVNNNELYTPSAFSKGKEARSILEYSMSDLAVQDRKTVEERMSQGMSMQEAAEEYLSDEYFDSWYEKIMNELKAWEG